MSESTKVPGLLPTLVDIYDKRAPGGKQGIARLTLGPDAVYFGCQHTGEAGGGLVCFLGKQHAVEFATALLMLAMQLPGDIPDSDITKAEDGT